ncbi:hypothetical protein EJ05DRAFT_515303 [Pseudovirgaria hyperparasitica]|uniref:Uncharacterized protein n=1 Tax=Pseudovirgaria hyperparasitica TaxID=470096 RepID=A0A6A6VRX1_9PEZI|nr:uncharacterized protein EJ05DRAFT_515303 [Pseudovirgaria hyperparasitica]KAF2752943.1 hypothetical protein EJ05DRAFT_515303 [Pseudovirgaria hyperparasitica]
MPEEEHRLSRENADLRELVLLLKTKSEDEAKAILNMIRSHDDPLSVIEKLRQHKLPFAWSDTPGQDSDKADEKVIKSAIRVPAQPWTSVATDEVVSELITAWFAWEDTTLFSYITLDLFVADMKASDPERATFCSPFLVNAICAAKAISCIARAHRMRSVHKAFKSMDKPAADATSESTWELSERFLAAVKEHLELQCGRASLPTIHGLYCLFQHASISGVDRAGSFYRLAAIDIISRLNLTKVDHVLKRDILHTAKNRARRHLNLQYLNLDEPEWLASLKFSRFSRCQDIMADNPPPSKDEQDKARRAVNENIMNNPAGTALVQAAGLSSQRKRQELKEKKEKEEKEMKDDK